MHEIDITPAQAHDLAAAEPGAECDPDERRKAVFLAALEHAYRFLRREGCSTPRFCFVGFYELGGVACYQSCPLRIRKGAVEDQVRPADGERR
jgi:hypothetical protein